MVLWLQDPSDLVLTLDHLVTLGEHPQDPHEGLLYLEYLKHQPSLEQVEKIGHYRYGSAVLAAQASPGLRFVALLLELRSLGKETPLRHRRFALILEGLSPGQSTLAIRSMKDQAAMGDGDAARAMVRAAIESHNDQTFACLCEALQEALPVLKKVEDFLVLYEDAPEFAPRLSEFRHIFFPPMAEFQSLPPSLPIAAPPAAARPTPKRRWSVSGLEGPGLLAVASSTGHLELIKISDDSLMQLPAGYRYSTYISPPGAYKGGGLSRRIVSSSLSDDLALLALYYHDGTTELLARASGKPVAELPRRDFTCFARRGPRIFVGGPAGLFSLDSHGSRKDLSHEPIRAIGARGLLVHSDGVVTVKGKERFQVDPNYRIRLAPNGSTVAIWDSHGEVEVFDLSGELVGRFYTGEDKPDLSYSLESDELVMAQKNGLKRWSLDGQRLSDLFPTPSEGRQRAERKPLEECSMDLDSLARHDGFFDRLSR
ncbi:hypothetical protein IV102_16240 [bacterium]|nr:hypothetical protein [bacterium]